MALTPEAVHKKTFTPVRLREGYDMGEVDQFLDEVEVELTRLHHDNDDLRSRLQSPSVAGPADESADEVTGDESTADESTGDESTGDESTGHGEQPVDAPDKQLHQPVPELPAVRTVAEASSAAVRLLEIAADNADQLVTEARENAERILAEARQSAETREADSTASAERIESDARARSASLDSETEQRRAQLFGELDRDKESLAREVENLREFEAEFRGRLKDYFQHQLETLDGDTDSGMRIAPAADDTPQRLRELLGEDSQPAQ